MRTLNSKEILAVSGGAGQCTPANSGNNYGGVSNPSTVGGDLIGIYEGLVEFASYVMERVAKARH